MGVGRVAAAFALSAAVLSCSSSRVAALQPGGTASDRALLFSGIDLWRHGSFTHGGLLWSPGGLDQAGFTFKLLVSGGNYRYLSGALGNAEVEGEQFALFALPGWRFRSGVVTATVFAGLDIQRHRLTPDDPSSGLRGTMSGFRAGAEFWIEPSAGSMIAFDASYSTVGPSFSARAAFGWRFADRFYAGPEIQGFAGDDSYNQFRIGLHVTAYKTGPYEWSAAAGWAWDSGERDSLYGHVGLLIRQ